MCEVRVVLSPRRRCIRDGLVGVVTVSPRVVVDVCILDGGCGFDDRGVGLGLVLYSLLGLDVVQVVYWRWEEL